MSISSREPSLCPFHRSSEHNRALGVTEAVLTVVVVVALPDPGMCANGPAVHFSPDLGRAQDLCTLHIMCTPSQPPRRAGLCGYGMRVCGRDVRVRLSISGEQCCAESALRALKAACESSTVRRSWWELYAILTRHFEYCSLSYLLRNSPRLSMPNLIPNFSPRVSPPRGRAACETARTCCSPHTCRRHVHADLLCYTYMKHQTASNSKLLGHEPRSRCWATLSLSCHRVDGISRIAPSP